MLVELFLLVSVLVAWAVYRDRKKSGMPPGPPEIPFFGNVAIHHVHQLEYYRKKYGNIYTTRFGNARHVIISSYEMVSKVFGSPDFGDRPHNLKAVMNVDPNEPGGIVFANGTQWAHERRFLVRCLKDLGVGKSYIEQSIQFEAQDMVNNLKNLNCKPTKYPRAIRLAVLNVVWRLTANKRFELDSHLSSKVNEVSDAIEALVKSSEVVFHVPLFPVIDYLPQFIKNYIWDIGTMAKYKRELRSITVKHIEEHQKTLDVDQPADIIDEYLAAIEKKEDSDTLTFGALIQTVVDLFSAGSDTTAGMMRFLILNMIKYPEKTLKCQQEIDSVVPKDTLVSVVNRESLQYVEAYIEELHRHSSMTFMAAQRMATRDTFVKGYFIPKGTGVSPNSYFINNDPDHWENPEQFMPERFIDEDGKFQPKKRSFAFGAGRRKCVGEQLARLELYIFTSALLQNFNIELPPGKQLDDTIVENAIFRVRAPIDQELIFKPR